MEGQTDSGMGQKHFILHLDKYMKKINKKNKQI